jgi:hypothetical protein
MAHFMDASKASSACAEPLPIASSKTTLRFAVYSTVSVTAVECCVDPDVPVIVMV